jgi:hypothetical protein
MVIINTAAGLPPALAAAIPTIRWPLGPTSCPALYYESLESLKAVRNVPTPHLLDDLPSQIESLFPPTDTDKRHFGLVATALISLVMALQTSVTISLHHSHGPMTFTLPTALPFIHKHRWKHVPSRPTFIVWCTARKP